LSNPPPTASTTRRSRWAIRIAWVVFGVILVGGIVLVLLDRPEDFGDQEVTTTVAVMKGPGARRYVHRVPSPPKSASEGSSRSWTTENSYEHPRGRFARGKETTEEVPASFLENLIGNDGLLLAQLAGVVLAAFVGAAIAYRVVEGNFEFKLGGLDFSIRKAVAQTTDYGFDLTDSVKKIEERVVELEGAIPGLDSKGFDADVPSKAALMRRLPRVIAAEVEAQAAARSEPPSPAEEPMESRSEPVARVEKEDPGDADADAEKERKQHQTARRRQGLLKVEPLESLRRVVILRSPHEGNKFDTLVQAIFRRSAHTYSAICDLIRQGEDIEAGMLVEPLFEDTIVAHWLAFNREDPDWLVRRFLEDASGAGALRDELKAETDFKIPFATDSTETEGATEANDRPEAPAMWWDPGEEGEGRGAGVGLAGIVAKLEEASTGEAPLFPPFATDKGPFSGQLEAVIRKWLTQLGHTSAAGLPFAPAPSGDRQYAASATSLVSFSAAWLFALDLYLAARLDGSDPSRMKELDEAWLPTLKHLGFDALGLGAGGILHSQWTNQYGR
jgi:hypothetical protein